MKTVLVSTAASLLVSIAVSSCSPSSLAPPADGGLSDAPGSDAPASVEQVCKTYAFTRCTYLDQCSMTWLPVVYGSVAQCEEYFRTSCMATATAPMTGAAAAHYAACTMAISSWACADIIYGQNPPPACAAGVGGLANGGTCSVNGQCQSSFCLRPAGSDCGTCSAMPQPGDPCVNGTQCGPGLECALAVGKCANHAAVGTSCGNSQPCAVNLVCVAGVCTQTAASAGATCNPLGAGCDATKGLSCNGSTDTCATLVLAQPGEACGVVGDQEQICTAGLCERGVCVAQPLLGQPCEVARGSQCLGFSECIATTDGGNAGTCQIPGTACH
jgi:hypothetical protein